MRDSVKSGHEVKRFFLMALMRVEQGVRLNVVPWRKAARSLSHFWLHRLKLSEMGFIVM